MTLVTNNTGGSIVSWSISPTVLPSGLSFNSSNGDITGTATADHANTTYTITANNSSGSDACTFDIVVTFPTFIETFQNPSVNRIRDYVFSNNFVNASAGLRIGADGSPHSLFNSSPPNDRNFSGVTQTNTTGVGQLMSPTGSPLQWKIECISGDCSNLTGNISGVYSSNQMFVSLLVTDDTLYEAVVRITYDYGGGNTLSRDFILQATYDIPGGNGGGGIIP